MTAWKNLERRICRTLGGTRTGPLGRYGSDCQHTPFSVETKRTTRYCVRRSWIDQARRQAKAEAKPWLLVVAEHNDRQPIAIMDFYVLAELAQQAGWIPNLEINEDVA